MSAQKQIALMAFEARPGFGTEAGLAWQWGRAYRRLGWAVTVVTQKGRYGAVDEEQWASEEIRVVRVGQFGDQKAPQTPGDLFRTRRAYWSWSRESTAWLRAEQWNGTVQHLSLSSVRLPWPTPPVAAAFVLGPVGGGHTTAFRGVQLRSLPHELLRHGSLFPLAVQQRRAVRKAGEPRIAYVTNEETEHLAKWIGVPDPRPLLVDGVDRSLIAGPRREPHTKPQLLWAGRMVGSKRPDLAIRILRALRDRGVAATLTMAGDGPELPRLGRLASNLGVDAHVTLVGRVDWTEMIDLYDRSDVFLFHSLRDTGSVGVLEAAARGVPSLAIRHQAVGYLVPQTVAFGPTRVQSAQALVASLTAAGEGLLGDVDAYARASSAAIAFATENTWDRKASRVITDLASSSRW